MGSAGALELLEDVKGSFETLVDACEHVAAQMGCTVAAVRVADYRPRSAGPISHASNKLNPDQETLLMAVTQAISVNNVALSLAQMRLLVL